VIAGWASAAIESEEIAMALNSLPSHYAAGPKQRQQHRSHDENVDEPPQLVEREATEIQHEVPADDNESVEDRQDEKHEPPAFEE
jgi:hypothetical protein